MVTKNFMYIATFLLLYLLASATTIADSSTISTSKTTSTSNTPPDEAESINTNSTIETSISTSTSTTQSNNDDARIVGDIYDNYTSDSALNGTALTVSCVNGVVNISGSVTMTSQAEQAVIAAKSVKGVKEVRSSINVTTNQIDHQETKSPNY